MINLLQTLSNYSSIVSLVTSVCLSDVDNKALLWTGALLTSLYDHFLPAIGCLLNC